MSDKVNQRLMQAQHNVEEIALKTAEESNNKSLKYALEKINNIASQKNVAISLKKIGTDEEYTIKTSKNNSETFSASREIRLDNGFYMLTVKRLMNVPNLGNSDIVKDILYFEFVILFIMLLILGLVLYLSYTKPLVKLSSEIKQYGTEKTFKTEWARRDELGQLQNTFYKLMNNLNEEKKIQDRIIASISHDIKTPLTSVLGYSENLLKKELPPERKKKYINTIYNQAKDIEGIVEEFDNYISNKLDSQLHQLKYSVKYICDMLKDEYSQYLAERNMTFELVNNCHLNCSISMDLSKVRRVFANVIGNSIRHANTEKLNITITVWEKASEIFYKISDNGYGVKEDELQHIFEPFYTTDKSRRVSGLGLSICKDIIEAHGGKITAENNSIGGFSIIFSMPELKL
ncbi:sensor histidine kinase [Clostridium omnivorum]|uniref:sensor histidine kinase n=1 Tax=Clostridium omnivorum TaxID=1604902 RepID=UPI00223214DB|nr:HAMP domain-containing sensor histidine kinase [Clostridium sp. E14]